MSETMEGSTADSKDGLPEGSADGSAEGSVAVAEKPAEAAPVSQGQNFKANWQAAPPRLVVRLGREFTIEQWPEIEALFQKQSSMGRNHWRFDLCDLTLIPSRLMGVLIGLNAILMTRNGAVELVVREDSSVAHSIRQARLDRLLTITLR